MKPVTIQADKLSQVQLQGLVFVTTARLTGNPSYGGSAGGPDLDRGAEARVQITVPNGMETMSHSVLMSQELVDGSDVRLGDDLVILIAKRR